jgi:hypothetical protein
MRRNTVLTEFKNFSAYIRANYVVEDCQMFEEESEGNVVWYGYQVQKDGATLLIKMPYLKSGEDELSIKDRYWTVQQGEQIVSGFPTLRYVFTQLHIQER